MPPGVVCQIFYNKSENHIKENGGGGGGGGGGRHTDAKRREGEDSDQNIVSLFDLLFSYLSYFNLYGFYKHDVLFIDYELTH